MANETMHPAQVPNPSASSTEKPFKVNYTKKMSDSHQITSPLNVDPETVSKHRSGTIPLAPTNGVVSGS